MAKIKSRSGAKAKNYAEPEAVSTRGVTFFCVLWSLFQLWTVADFPFYLSEITGLKLVLNSQEVRQIHLAFGLGLALFAYPSTARISPLVDRAFRRTLGFAGVAACLYLFVFKLDISGRAGLPNIYDLIVSLTGMVCIMVAVYRVVGLPLVIVAGAFLFYVMFGHLDLFPDAMRWKGASINKATWHFWMQTEGVFGVALGVSAATIFLFVLFGALLESAGAGNYFIKLSFAALGHLRGGPAKAAVMASGLSGVYSGSSIANVVTTGTFTIPLMKKTGLSAEKAGAVEVASSTNGQLTPPVMGAAAFLIAEFTGVGYLTLVKHAALPALVSYIALFYIVHLEVSKLGLKGLNRVTPTKSLLRRMTGFMAGFLAVAAFAVAAKFALDLMGGTAPALTLPVVAIGLGGIYLFLLRIAARQPDLTIGLDESEMKLLPTVSSVAVTGLHFVIPIVVLLWCVLVNRLSPGLSAYWACVAMMFVLITQHPIKAFFRGEGAYKKQWRRGFCNLIEGLEKGARNMVSIAIATAIAGIIIGTVSLTGAHQFIGHFVETISAGSLILMLLLVAVMSLILGMGLPTTANYIVVSSLMAPVIVMVGAQNGLVVPLVAVHLFVFYFGILADDTPPVGLAAYAAAAISRGDPIRTGIQGFAYDIRTAILPFMFIFNTGILLIDVGVVEAIIIFIATTAGMIAFCSATQHYMLVKNRMWETLILLLVAFTLFRPDFWLDKIQPRYTEIAGSRVIALLDGEVEGIGGDMERLRIRLTGPDFDDASRLVSRNTILELGDSGGDDSVGGDSVGGDSAGGDSVGGDSAAVGRLAKAGLNINTDTGDGTVAVEEPFPGTPLFQELSGFDFYGDTPVTLDAALLENRGRLPQGVFYLPALAMLVGIWAMQRRRRSRGE